MKDTGSPARMERAYAIFERFCAGAVPGDAAAERALLAANPDCATDLQALLAALHVQDRGLEQTRRGHEALRTELSGELARLQDGDRYELRCEIGQGGMGVVYEAYDKRLGRTLAWKQIRDVPAESFERGSIATINLLRRFQREAAITAHLDHPGVVPLHDVGIDHQGRPFYTMKLVEGPDLRRLFQTFAAARASAPAHVDVAVQVTGSRRRWGMKELVEVLLRVGDTIAFAHQRGIVHRDLKPQNVMVGDHGEVYVMDWGLACRTWEAEDSRPADRTAGDGALSVHGTAIGSPFYMPPEQARGVRAEIGPHSDVYALGAMLYELLGGRAPYEVHGREASTEEIVVAIKVGPPQRLPRDAGPPELVAICEQAMAYLPHDRFPTAAEFTSEVRSFLDGRVVPAYANGPWQEIRKWVQRNTALGASLAAAIVLLAAGLTTSLVFKASADERAAALAASNQTIERQKDDLLAKTKEAQASAQLAETRWLDAEAQKAVVLEQKAKAVKAVEETKQVADFQSKILSELSVDEFGHAIVVEMRKDLAENLERIGRTKEEVDTTLASFDAAIKPGNPTNVAQRVLETTVFEPAVLKTENDYKDTPLLAAMLQTPLGNTLLEIGLHDLGVRAARAAVASRRAELGDDHPDTCQSITRLALLLMAQGKLDEAESLFREALAGLRAEFGDDHDETLITANSLALLLRAQGKFDEAEPLFRQTLARRHARLGDDHVDTLRSINNLALLLKAQGKFDEAEPLYRDALAGFRSKIGNDQPDTLTVIDNLAQVLEAQGKLSEAEPLFREALAGCRAKRGDDHPQTLQSTNNLALLLYNQGKFDEAEPFYRAALAGFCSEFGNDHPNTLMVINNLARLLQDQGKLDEAEQLHRETLARRRAKLGDDHPDTLQSINNLCGLLYARRKYADAEQLLRQALAERRATRGDDDADTLRSINNLGAMLHAQGKTADAEQLFRQALAGRRALFGDDHVDTLQSINNLGGLLYAQGKTADAEQLFRQALAGRRAKLGDDHADTLVSMTDLGIALKAQGKLEEAEPLHRQVLAARRAKLGDSHHQTLLSISNLGSLLRRRGKLSEAETLYREAVAGFRAKLGDGHVDTLVSSQGLALTLQGLGRFAEAENLFTKVIERAARDQTDAAFLRDAETRLRDLYRAWHVAEPSAGHGRQADAIDKLLEKK